VDGVEERHSIHALHAQIRDHHLRPGDRVAVEDPGYVAVFDLVAALGLVAEPVAVDDAGPRPEALARALGAGVEAFVLTPRAQNPTGAALDAGRAPELRAVLRRHPATLVVEDDHAGPVAGVSPLSVCHGRERWAVVRSVSKSLGPDLRLAILTGDATTVLEEAATIAALADAGWAVRAGERYRLETGPAVRITVAGLEPRDADRLAAALARSLRPERRRASA